MRKLGIERAHIAGHSSGVAMALQLALDAPEAAHTLTLMEPTRPAPPTATQARFGQEIVQPAVRHYQAGDPAGAVDTFVRSVVGPGYRPALDRGLPGGLRPGSRQRQGILQRGTARLPAVDLHRRRRAPHPAAGARRPRRCQPPDVHRTPAAAAMAAQRRTARWFRPREVGSGGLTSRTSSACPA
jgi:pimeloyl-ACP methyl ester carboxylesterase